MDSLSVYARGGGKNRYLLEMAFNHAIATPDSRLHIQYAGKPLTVYIFPNHSEVSIGDLSLAHMGKDFIYAEKTK